MCKAVIEIGKKDHGPLFEIWILYSLTRPYEVVKPWPYQPKSLNKSLCLTARDTYFTHPSLLIRWSALVLKVGVSYR